MKIFYIFCILVISLFFITCKVGDSHIHADNNMVKKELHSQFKDTMFISSETYCFQSNNICMDSLCCIFSANSNDGLWRFSDNPENYTFVNKLDTFYINPINFQNENIEISNQFLKLFKVLGCIKNSIKNSLKISNLLDSLSVPTSSFFDLNIETPLVVLDTMKYNYKYYEGERILEGTTNLFVELKIDRLEECNLNYLLIKNDTIRQNDFVIHRYKSINDICEKFDFTLSFKTNEKNIIDWSYIFDLDDWILEHFEFPKENKK
jgi:hypothetical protein